MATYLNGVTDYIPQIQPFQPDLNFYQNLLEAKQAQYTAGYNKISSVYGSLLNSRLTRQDNIEVRDDYFTRIQNDIEKYSAMDLSKVENVNNAVQVFKPLLEDNYLQRDMVFSSAMDVQRGRSNYFKNCMNPKECGGAWWDVGDSALNYLEQDFAKATREETLRFQNPEYVPYINTYKEAMSTIKEFKQMFDTDYLSKTPDGKYNIITTNGERLIPTLESYLSSTVGSDPQVQRMYETQAYVDRKNYISAKAAELGEEGAERDYINQVFLAAEEYNSQREAQLNQNSEEIQDKKNLKKENAEKHGVNPEEDGDIFAELMGLDEQKAVIDKEKAQADQLSEMVDPLSREASSLDVLRRKADYIKGQLLNANTIYKAARDYAMGTKKEKMDADPYALADYNSMLRRQEEREKAELEAQNNKMMMEYLGTEGRSVDSGPSNTDPDVVAEEVLSEELAKAQGTSAQVYDLVAQETFNSLNNLRKTGTANQRKYAEKKMIELFGVAETREEDVSQFEQDMQASWNSLSPEQKQTDYGNNYGNYVSKQGMSTWQGLKTGLNSIGSWISGNKPTKTVLVKSGYLVKNADGEYGFNANQQKKTDPNDPNYYKKVAARINEFRNSKDFKDLFYTTDEQTRNRYAVLEAKYNATVELENDINNARKHNLKVAVDNLKTEDWRFGLFLNPDNGWQVSKEEFVKKFQEIYKNDQKYYPTRRFGAKGEVYAVSDADRYAEMRNHAEEAYDDLNEKLWEANKSGRFNKDYRTEAMPLGGSSGRSAKGMEYAVDPVYGDAAKSNRLVLDLIQKDLYKVLDDPNLYSVMEGDARYINKEMLGDVSDEAKQKANLALKALMTDFLRSSPKGSKNKDDRAAFTMKGYNIALNDKNMVGVTFTPTPAYLQANRGNNKATPWDGLDPNSDGSITVFFNANETQSQFFNQFKVSKYQAKLNLNGEYLIGDPKSKTGYFRVTQDRNGGLSIEDNTMIYNNGKWERSSYDVMSSTLYPELASGANADVIIEGLEASIQNMASYNQNGINASRKK